MKRFFKNKKTAFGLVESLLAIAIFGTAIITATAVTISSLKIVKDNELADFATSMIIRTVEFTKSTELAAAELEGNTPSGPWYFIVEGNPADSSDALGIVSASTGGVINDCTSSSDYYIDVVDAAGNSSGFVLCIQLITNQLSSGNYETRVRGVYVLSGETRITEVSGFRLE